MRDVPSQPFLLKEGAEVPGSFTRVQFPKVAQSRRPPLRGQECGERPRGLGVGRQWLLGGAELGGRVHSGGAGSEPPSSLVACGHVARL